jgi:hypothetical protein
MLIVTNELTGFAFVYQHLWFIFGMALAIPFLRNEGRINTRIIPELQLSSNSTIQEAKA